jgi:hypothetical protein
MVFVHIDDDVTGRKLPKWPPNTDPNNRPSVGWWNQSNIHWTDVLQQLRMRNCSVVPLATVGWRFCDGGQVATNKIARRNASIRKLQL